MLLKNNNIQAVSDTPRQLNLQKTFDSIVDWIEEKSSQERAPGLIMGLSGTDSILTFLACAKAFERMGKPEKIIGINFQHTYKHELDGAQKPLQCVNSEDNWVVTDIFPWLKERAPQSCLEVDSSIPFSNENLRWSHLFNRAANTENVRLGLNSDHYFPVGTRNATEQALGTYSQISKSISMLPIVNIFKSEVLDLCRYLGVPQIAVDKSGEVDCDCGRFETQVRYLRELDLFIMAEQGLLSKDYLNKNISPDALNAVLEFYLEETMANQYRSRTPYIPDRNLVVTI